MKLYYNMGWQRERMLALHDAMLAETGESPYTEWMKQWLDDESPREDKGLRVTTRVPCGEFFETRDDALRAHATQVDPDGFWFAVPLAIQQKVWPTDDFQLVRSSVGPIGTEDDLFAGVREQVGV
jgi:mycothiol S-conjugate amidase